jgi:Resolvase, N terminal domain
MVTGAADQLPNVADPQPRAEPASSRLNARKRNPFRTPADVPISRPQPGPAVLQLTRTMKISVVGAKRTLPIMSETLIGYARCSTDEQDLTAQRQRLAELGVADERIYLDHGLTGTNRKRPGLDQALAAVREGDTLVVPKLDRLARSVPDAREIGDSLAARGIKHSLGGPVYDPADPWAKCSSTSWPPSPWQAAEAVDQAAARACAHVWHR